MPEGGTLSVASSFFRSQRLERCDKDRIEGSAQQAKSKVKEVAGKATGEHPIAGSLHDS